MIESPCRKVRVLGTGHERLRAHIIRGGLSEVHWEVQPVMMKCSVDISPKISRSQRGRKKRVLGKGSHDASDRHTRPARTEAEISGLAANERAAAKI